MSSHKLEAILLKGEGWLEALPQAEDCEYLGVLFMSDGRTECEFDQCSSSNVATVSAVVKVELSQKGKLLTLQSVFLPSPTVRF